MGTRASHRRAVAGRRSGLIAGLLAVLFLPAALACAEPPAEAPPPVADGLERLTPAEREAVRQLIAEELQKHDRKKKQDDEQKKQEADAKKQQEDERKKAEGYTVGSSLGLTANWQDGLWFSTANKDFVAHLGGAFQYDGAWYNPDDALQQRPLAGVGRFQDGTVLRRARIRTEGHVWEVVEFSLEFEFSQAVTAAGAVGNNPFPGTNNTPDAVFSTPAPTDAWIALTHIPVLGAVRIGNQKEPFSLEHINSFRFLEFMERSYLFDAAQTSAFNGARSPGISFLNTWLDGRLFAAAGVFKNTSNPYGYGIGDGQYAVTGRLAGLPYWEDDGRYLVHLGAGASHRDPVNGQILIRVREPIRGAPQPLLNNLINTDPIRATNQELLNLEAAAVFGPLTLQSEFLGNWVNDASTVRTGPVGTVFFPGFYVEALYFLTGEVRPYDKKLARFGRVRPNENAFFVPGRSCCCGTGAWEVGVRYQQIDVSDKGINGGALHGVTVGLNWYWNPNSKLQWNYDISRRSDAGNSAVGTVQAFGMRAAFDF